MRRIALLALALAAPAMAQDADPDFGPPIEPRYTDNSANFPLDPRIDGGEPTVAMVSGATLTLTHGDTMQFRVDAAGVLTDARHVAKDTRPAMGEIRVHYTAMGGASVLHLTNAGPLAYRFVATLSTDAAPAPVCTLLPGLSSIEHWPYVAASITLSRFTPAPDGAIACE